MNEIKRIGGGVNQAATDPLGLLPGKLTDPLGIFKGKTATVAAPAAPAVMPDADSEAVAAARRRRIAAMKNRGGRASTILGGEDMLGG